MNLRNVFLSTASLLLITACGGDDNVSDNSSLNKTQHQNESCDDTHLCVDGLLCENNTCRIVCQSDNDCNHMQTCQNDKCINNPDNTCNKGWDGEKCNKCAEGFFGENCQECQDCGDHGSCKDGLNGDGTCKCGTGWLGDKCNEKNPCQGNFTGDNCDQCLDGYYGARCSECTCKNGTCNDTINGDGFCRSGSCANGFAGNNCDECADPLKTGNDCNECADPLKTGDKCDQCLNPAKTGDNCDQCISGFAGSDCNIPITCKNGTLDTDTGKCSSCNNKWAGDNCDTCSTGYGPNCVACTRPNGQYDKANASDCVLTIDNDSYQIVDIDGLGHIWMAENLRKATENTNYTFAPKKENGSPVTTMGFLYAESAISDLCPSGWHIPTTNDVKYLFEAIDTTCGLNTSCDSTALRPATWNNGTNRIGFNAQPAGTIAPRYKGTEYHSSDDWTSANYGSQGNIWFNNGITSDQPRIIISSDTVSIRTVDDTTYYYSVRCVRDNQ